MDKNPTFDEYYKSYFEENNLVFNFKFQNDFPNNIPLNNSSKKYCFEFKKLQGLPCPCCGKIMTTREELLAFTQHVKTKTGMDLISELKFFEPRLRGVEKDVVKKLKQLAKNNPDKNLKELVILLYRNSIKQLENSQKKVMAKISKMSDKLEGQTLLAVKKDITFVSRLLRKRKNTQTFKRKTFIAGIYRVLAEEKSGKNKVILEKLIERAKMLPTSGGSFDAFIVKYHRRSIEEIAQRLLDASLASTEHIQPRSDGGVNDPANYLVQCKFCNNERSSMTYREWLKKHPEMKRNVQIYIDKIISMIVAEQIVGYDFYPLVIKSTLNKESEGLLNLSVNNIMNFLQTKYAI